MMNRAFITGSPVYDGSGAKPVHWTLFLTCPMVFSFSLTCIYLAMRGVMRLGGFVASGGPYVIAHQAPGWIWLFPVSIFLMLGSIFASIFAGSKAAGPNIMSLSWSALFLALGWNFVEFGFGIGMGGQPVVGWIICAFLFILMGGVPLVFIMNSFFSSLAGHRDTSSTGGQDISSEKSLSWSASLLLQVFSAAVGIFLGYSFFMLLD